MMTDLEPKHIICAVRGGAESRETVSQAIDLALAGGARLTFLHVMDAEFLQYATIGPLSVVYSELVEMGTFAMMILCDRAQRRGVTNVDYVVQEGNIHKQLLQFAITTRGEVLVMGHPTRSPGRNVFESGELDDFMAEIERVGHIHVIQVMPGDNKGG
jgi:nucleotide-binding universal stress UspA family protein